MGSKRFFGPLRAAMVCVACTGVMSGCNNGGEEIPLAKVPPPPDSFSKVQAKSSIPKGASPANANELRR